MTTLEGQVAFVTGAASGIGRGSARALARQGAAIAVCDRNLEGAGTVVQDISDGGGRAIAIGLDIADSAAVQAAVDRTLAEFGQIDVLVNCAGIAPRKPTLDLTDDEWHQVIGVNLDGTHYVSRAVGRVMADRGRGTMILIASDRGIYGLAGGAHYSASKAGVVAYAKSLALELGSKGVTVNAINPGTTDTPLARGTLTDEEWQKRWGSDPLGRLSTPEDIAEIVLFLAGPGGKFMTGQLITTRMRFG